MNKPQFPHLNYLTEVTGEKALQFATAENKISDQRLKTDPRYQKAYDELFKIISSKDKLPAIRFINDEVYNFWQDDKHVRGILRKTTVSSFNSGQALWKTVLDIDLLAKTEEKNWVYKGLDCLYPKSELCLVSLSDGGKDATVIREFNLKTAQFVQGGFNFPESKTSVDWYDENTLLVGDGTDPTTLNSSGYPTTIKVLKRGGDLITAPVLYVSPKTSAFAYAYVAWEKNKKTVFLADAPQFFEINLHIVNMQDLKLSKVPMPSTSRLMGPFKGQLIFYIREDFKKFKAGSLISVDEKQVLSESADFNLVFEPTQTEFYESTAITVNSVYIETLHDVKRRLKQLDWQNNQWIQKPIDFADKNGNQSIAALSYDQNHIYFSYTDFLTPSSYFYFNESTKAPAKKVLQAPAYFKTNDFKIEQFKVASTDGTQVPYFVVSPVKMKLNGKNPTLLYGYGGFEVSMTPQYLSSVGEIWLEEGGVYVLANIRGGGEYGPAWHRAALRENRHKAYQDFYAIAEDLFKRQITSPAHLGIKGGSNGGLLTSVAFTQRPELFNAVISEVPLANMLEYHQWLAGASWMEEYGSPEDPQMRKYLESYSPLHNLKKEAKYPEVFYLTSTKDDRVHPAHARQMVSRMKELGHPVLYNENIDGGHGRATNAKDWAELLALEFTYLYQKLMN